MPLPNHILAIVKWANLQATCVGWCVAGRASCYRRFDCIDSHDSPTLVRTETSEDNQLRR